MFPANTMRDRYKTTKRGQPKTIIIPIGSQISTEAIFDSEYRRLKIHCEDATGIPALATIRPQLGGVDSYDSLGLPISLTNPAGGFDWGIDFGTGVARLRIALSAVATAEVVLTLTAYDLVEVRAAPQITLGKPELALAGAADFGSTQVLTAVDEIYTITNTGTNDLIIDPIIVVPAGYTLTVAPTTSLLQPGDSVTFTVELDALVIGTYAGDIEITNNASPNPFLFAITGEVTI